MKTQSHILRLGLTALLAAVAVIVSVSAALASGDIVYSARYYAPSGGRYITHFHLYRIDPDGTGRKQITFGPGDDSIPSWSRDGREVRFVRQFGSSSKLMTCDAKGGHLRTIVKLPTDAAGGARCSPDGAYAVIPTWTASKYGVSVVSAQGSPAPGFADALDVVFSPDSRLAYIRTDRGVYVLDMAQCARARIASALTQCRLDDVAWLSDRQFVGIVSPSDSRTVELTVFDPSGKAVRSVICSWSGSTVDPGMATVDAGGRGLLSDPAGELCVDYVQDIGNSTVRPDNEYFRCSTLTGAMQRICDGQFLAWRPDRRSYCSATPRGLSQYDTKRSLWTAQLFVGRLGTGRHRTIVSGMVWVMGADWRNPRP